MAHDMSTAQYDFSGKTLFLTGASGTIGRAIAQRFVTSGANCVLTDLDKESVQDLAKSLDPTGRRVLALGLDATQSQAVDQAWAQAADRFGEIHALVTAAGLYRDALVADMSDEAWRQSISINLDSVFYICRSAIPHLAQDSAIVNIASLAGHRGSKAHAHYAAAKGAVLSFSRSLAVELAPKTRVNAVSPGLIDGPMVQNLLNLTGSTFIDQTPMKRLGTADEVASTIAFLCSSDASFITAASLHVNGGLYIAS
jgi:3-oxoacyl-[acyl-carrier protein] reductase